jgi:hypothetical protein
LKDVEQLQTKVSKSISDAGGLIGKTSTVFRGALKTPLIQANPHKSSGSIPSADKGAETDAEPELKSLAGSRPNRPRVFERGE